MSTIGVRSGDGNYHIKPNVNYYHQGPGGSGISSYATRGHSSLSGNGDGDCRNLKSGYMGDKDSVLSRRDTALTASNQESRTGHGDQYFGETQSKRNDTSFASLRGSPQFNLRSDNGYNSSQGGHQDVSRVFPRNYCIDSSYSLPTTNGRLGGRQYGRDRERMKDELADSNSMARTGSGILPGAILPDRGAARSHLLWRGTQSDTNSSIRKPEIYSSSLSGTTSTPSLNVTTGGRSRSGINENEDNRVSSLISEAQKAKEMLRSNVADASNQFQDRLTRPSASWNTVGIGNGGGMTMAELQMERQGNGNNKRLQQNAYRASLERQVEQKSKRIAEEERKFNAHPFGPNYEQPKSDFWQSSIISRPNRSEDIPIQKRLLGQNSSTRVSQYQVPYDRVAQARTNLQNSRISPDTYHHPSKNVVGDGNNVGSHYPNTKASSRHDLSNPSANNFRAHSSPSAGRNNDIPHPPHNQQKFGGMRMRPIDNQFQRSIPTREIPYQELRHPNNVPPRRSRDTQQPVPFYAPQRPYYAMPPLPHPQPQPQPHLMTQIPGYQYPSYPGAYPYPLPPQPAYYPYQPQPTVGYHGPPPPGPRMTIDPYDNQYPQVPIGHPNHYENGHGPEYTMGAESHQRSSKFEDDEMIHQKVHEIERQIHVERDDNNNTSWKLKISNPLRPSPSVLSDIDRLKDFVEEKLADKNMDFDELRDNVLGRPNNWKTTGAIVDLKPIKDLINRAELAEQIKINQKKKALQAAKEKEEEDKLERKIQEYYDLQKNREHHAVAQKEEWTRLHILNKKAVSKHFISKEDNFKSTPVVLSTSHKNVSQEFERENTRKFRPENPEESLARKIRSRSESRRGDYGGRGDHPDQNHSHREREENATDEPSYSYAKYIEQFNKERPPSPPVPALLPKTNEDTLIGKLSNKTFSRPRLSPSILAANKPNLKSRIALENGLKSKLSNSSF